VTIEQPGVRTHQKKLLLDGLYVKSRTVRFVIDAKRELSVPGTRYGQVKTLCGKEQKVRVTGFQALDPKLFDGGTVVVFFFFMLTGMKFDGPTTVVGEETKRRAVPAIEAPTGFGLQILDDDGGPGLDEHVWDGKHEGAE
jgi:hypothetical protein